MKHNYGHSDENFDHSKLPDEIFGKFEVPYSKTREEAWDELNSKLAERSPEPKTIFISKSRIYYAIAASIILLAGLFSLLRFYTSTTYCPPGQHMSYLLPDGSSVELNADSKLSYKPFWWWFDRQVGFEGEGFFKVEKGQNFAVISKLGRTEVLGTSFNIYSRDNDYNVACFTGLVRVTSFSYEEVVLSPEYEASVNPDGNIVVFKEPKAGISHSWINNMFSFTSRPLESVIKEIERQYGVNIKSNSPLHYSYTGYFSKNRPVEEVLILICKPFGLTFVKISEKEYEIVQN